MILGLLLACGPTSQVTVGDSSFDVDARIIGACSGYTATLTGEDVEFGEIRVLVKEDRTLEHQWEAEDFSVDFTLIGGNVDVSGTLADKAGDMSCTVAPGPKGSRARLQVDARAGDVGVHIDLDAPVEMVNAE